MQTAIYKCSECGDTTSHDIKDGHEIQWYCTTCHKRTAFKKIRGTTSKNIKRVLFPNHGKRMTVDIWATEDEMRETNPVFFRNVAGKRETYTVYNGCIIVRYTMRGFDGKPGRRRTVPYMYGYWPRTKKPCLMTIRPYCAGECHSIEDAKRYIDRILKNGQLDS